MPVIINNNYAATAASNNLSYANESLQRSLNRLSSGSRIVSPADDAGGLAVSMKLSAAAKRSGAALAGINNTTSFLQQQDGVLKVAGKVLERMGELKSLYDDPTKNSQDRDNYDAEFVQLRDQLTAFTSETFNGISLFGTGTLTVTTAEDGNTATAVGIAGKDLTDTSTGIGLMSSTSISSLGNSSLSLGSITAGLQNVAKMRATNGAEQNRMSFAAEVLTVNKANLEAATSRISDVDVAYESTQLARFNILVQSGTAMLSQANQSALSVLKLLQ
jgi:flagellin